MHTQNVFVELRIVGLLLMFAGICIAIPGHKGRLLGWLVNPDKPKSRYAWAALFIGGGIILMMLQRIENIIL
jgi:hypothetical protein